METPTSADDTSEGGPSRTSTCEGLHRLMVLGCPLMLSLSATNESVNCFSRAPLVQEKKAGDSLLDMRVSPAVVGIVLVLFVLDCWMDD